MIDKINNNQIQDLFDGKLTRAAQPKSADNQAASVQIDYAALIEKAVKLQQEDASAVEKAKQLLSSGALDDPKLIRQAAENIIDYGI